jgi:nucleoside-diphosphate-sugar epimerase
VVALVHRRSSPVLERLEAGGAVTIVRGDVTDPASFEGQLRSVLETRKAALEAVVHAAGRASDVGRRRAFRETNFESVRAIGAMVTRLNAGRFVFVSTTDVYGMDDFHGEGEDELPLTDRPSNPYPEFKVASERWIRENLPADKYAIVRPAAVWGVDDPTLTKRVADFLRASPWIVHFGKWRGRNRWPLAHVRNVADALFIAATLPGAAGKAVNVLDSEFTSTDEFYRIVASVYCPGKRFRTFTLPLWLVRPFAAAVSAVSNALNLDHPFLDPSSYALNVVSSNLDFGNGRFLDLMRAEGLTPVTREEGVRALRENLGSPILRAH